MQGMSDKHTECEQCRQWMMNILYPKDMEKLPAEVDEHIRTCSDCRRELESLKATLEMVRSIDLNIVPPKGLENRIMRAIEEETAGAKAVREGAAGAREAGLMDIIAQKVADFFRHAKPVVTHPAFATAMIVLVIGGFLFLIKDVVRQGEEGIFEQDKERVLPAQPAPPMKEAGAEQEISKEPFATLSTEELEGKEEHAEKARVEVDETQAAATADELKGDRAMERETTGETAGWGGDEEESKPGAVDKTEKETKEASKPSDVPVAVDEATKLKAKTGGYYFNADMDDLEDSMGSEGLSAGETSLELITKGAGEKSAAGPSRHETTEATDEKAVSGGIVSTVPETATGAGGAPGGIAKSDSSSPFATSLPTSAPPPATKKKKALMDTAVDYAMPMETAELEEEAAVHEEPAPAPSPASASAISAAKVSKKSTTTKTPKKSKKKGKSAQKTYYKLADAAEEAQPTAALAAEPKPKPKTAKKPAKAAETPKEEEKAVSGKKQDKSKDKDIKKDPYYEARDRFASGDYDGALSYLQSIVKKTSPSSASMAGVYHMLAKTWKQKGNSSKALIYYENLFARYPSYGQISQARWEAAQLYIAAGDTKQAKKLLDKLVKNPAYKDKAQKKLDAMD